MKRGYHTLTFVLLLSGLNSFVSAATTQSKPPDALTLTSTQLGECYAQVIAPPVFEMKETTKIKREGTERIEVLPPKYEWTEQAVMVQEPTERLEVIPATYEWVEERVQIKPASTRIEVIPPQYETVEEKRVSKPAHQVWKVGTGPFQRIDHATGHIVCLLEKPATYTTVTKHMLKEPAKTRKIPVPAEYVTVRKRVVKTPATVRTVKIPAQYKIIKVAKLVKPAGIKRVETPAEYQKVAQLVKVRESRMAWEPVLCETNVTPDVVRSLQRSLQQAGYDPGKIDGRLGPQTMASLAAYQRQNDLSVGELTLETLDSLGLKMGRSTHNKENKRNINSKMAEREALSPGE